MSAGGSAAAPGPRLIQSLASTLRPEQDADLLRGPEDAAAWLRKAELLPADAGLSNSEHAALLRLRDSIRDVLAARAAGRPDADADARLTRALADGRLVLTIGQGGDSPAGQRGPGQLPQPGGGGRYRHRRVRRVARAAAA